MGEYLMTDNFKLENQAFNHFLVLASVFGIFGILESWDPKVDMKEQRCQNQGPSGFQWCLLLNLKMPKCQKCQKCKNAKMSDQRCQSNSGDTCFWIKRCQNGIIRDHRSQGDIWDILWCCILELMMPKWCQKLPWDNKTSYTFEGREINKVKLLFTE